MEPVFRAFTEETGIEVRFTFGTDAELRERIKAEGRFTLADVYIGVDAGNLWLAAQEGLLQPVESETLTQNIPEQFRDPENRWFGLTLRIRTIVYHPDRVRPDELSTYEALADPRWRGRLCLRPATKVYTQSLVASLIAAHGVEKAEEIVRGWVENTKRENFIDSDTRIAQTIAAGGCDVGIINHYYLARLLDENPDFPVRLFWANQGEGERGVHANVSGAGVVTWAHNRENAITLLEWLSEPKGQKLFADGNFEYPANPDVELHPLVAGFGTPKIDPIPVWKYGELQKAAIELLNRVGYP
jgi:iron(III) transport system substrate-binding protein